MANSDITVLVVDDDPSIRELVESALVEEGYNTTTASSVQEGVDVMKQGGIDLTISDIYMGDGTGLELAGKIKAEDPKARVVIMTGAPDSDNIRGSVDTEVDAYLIKPITIDNLLSLVRELT